MQSGSPEARSPNVSSEPRPPIADHELLRVIGRGAYGEVWLARHARLGALRAVKVVRRDEFGDDRPFRREFEGIQKYEPLSRGHLNLVSILHVGGTDECFYYVMELADARLDAGCSIPDAGSADLSRDAAHPASSIQHQVSSIPHPASYSPHTLRSELRQHGALPIDRCLEIGHALASALAHLHANGLVHRDVKPSNVIFVGGVAKLADIGLVAGVDDARSFVGTEGYIPPEGPGTPSADCYSLGKLLYELSTGHDRNSWPEPPSDLATRPDRERLLELNAILHRACAPEPRQRYVNGGAMLADFERLCVGRSVKARHAWQLRTRFGMKFSVASVGVALFVATVWLLFTHFSSSTLQTFSAAQPVATIAVLPFDDESPRATGNDFNEGLTDEIRSGLTRVPALGVIGKSSSIAFKTGPDRLGVARSNKVSAVLEGRVRRTGEEVRLSLELTDTRSGRLLWSDTLTAPAKDPFAFQLAVLQRLQETLGVRLTESQRILLGSRPTQNLEAYRLYWEAKALIHVGNSKAFDTAVQMLTKATELDPDFSLAYSELADCYSSLAEFCDRPPRELWASAKAAAQRALNLTPDSSEAHVSMGGVEETFDYNWTGAESEYRRAVELNPNNAKAHWWLGLFLAGAGRSAEARPHRERAMELDPLEAMNPMNLGHQLFYNEGRYEEALVYYQKAYALRPHPEMKRNIGELYQAMGRDADAMQAYDEHWLGSGESTEAVNELRAAFERSGWRGYWETRLAQMDRSSSKYHRWHDRATYHDRLGNTNEVFACLTKSIENREFYASQIRNPNSWKPYRADPRFKELLRMLNAEQ